MGGKNRKRQRKSESKHEEPRRALRGIPRAPLLVAACVLGLLAAITTVLIRPAPQSFRPLNIVLVTADTLRADRLPSYGYDRISTPYLDEMASSVVLFENASTVVPLTLPAHSSMFTGTFPMYHGVREDPLERNNLASQRAATVGRFKTELDRLVDEFGVEGIDEQEPSTLDAETQQQLAALGYLGGPSRVNVDLDRPLADPKDKIGLFNLIKEAGADSSQDRIEDAMAKIESVLLEDPDILEADRIELFDTKTEPAERVDIASAEPELAARLHRLLRSRLDTSRPPARSTPRPFPFRKISASACEGSGTFPDL